MLLVVGRLNHVLATSLIELDIVKVELRNSITYFIFGLTAFVGIIKSLTASVTCHSNDVEYTSQMLTLVKS